MGLNLLNIPGSVRGDSDYLTDRFYIPCLKESIRYFRAVGFFTSYSLASVAAGLTVFLRNSGSMLFIASPFLSPEDIEAIAKGIRNKKKTVENVIRLELENVEDELIRNRLGVLSWLIAKQMLTIKIAFTKDLHQTGIYHEKLGLFQDESSHIVAFSGSANETYGGLVSNFENIDVFCSFKPEDEVRVADKMENFQALWENRTSNLEVTDFTEVTWQSIHQYQQQIEPFQEFYLKNHPSFKQISENRNVYVNFQETPRMPGGLKLFSHQKTAMKQWFLHGGRGIMEMATGTGKTKTALSVAQKLADGLKNLAIIIICPYKHLVTQWRQDCKEFGLNPILGFESKRNWLEALNSRITAYNINAVATFSLITTNKTFADPDMQHLMRKIRNNAILIADEMHNLGAEKLGQSLPPNITYRLGLSATPKRHFDPQGTQVLYDYFGNVIFKYTLKEAIDTGILTPYKYYPHLIELTEEESEEYHELSRKIGKFIAIGIEKDADESSMLKSLLIRRARLIASARNKINCLYELVKKDREATHILFYCGDGTVESDISLEENRQLDVVLKMLGNKLNMRVHPFTAREDRRTRKRISQQFADGTLQGLVAIRCLDEGVDIPATRTAYILASSSNPKQFIQRRGRLLRKHTGKEFAIIHDLITIPQLNTTFMDDAAFNIERGLIKKELNRFIEFSKLSLNEGEALNKIRIIKKRYHLMDM